MYKKFETGQKEKGAKKFKWPNTWQAKFKQSKKEEKKTENILLLYLNMKGVWDAPKLVPIVSGDIVVIKTKVYQINPEDITQLGKYRAYVCKEIDKQFVKPGKPNIVPISNTDYEDVKLAGRSTSNHPTLLKAIFSALQQQKGIDEKKKMKISPKAIVGGLVVLAILFYIMTQFGGTPAG